MALPAARISLYVCLLGLHALHAFNQKEGYEKLSTLDEKWSKKYPVPLQGWYNNWEHLSTFFKYDAAICKTFIRPIPWRASPAGT